LNEEAERLYFLFVNHQRYIVHADPNRRVYLTRYHHSTAVLATIECIRVPLHLLESEGALVHYLKEQRLRDVSFSALAHVGHKDLKALLEHSVLKDMIS